ncbi:MAG: hypothetical protein ACE5JK_03250 [Candidatus Omnitrophota bacterium]
MRKVMALIIAVVLVMGSTPAFAGSGGFFNDTYNFFADLGKPRKAKAEKKEKPKRTKKEKKGSPRKTCAEKGSGYIK